MRAGAFLLVLAAACGSPPKARPPEAAAPPPAPAARLAPDQPLRIVCRQYYKDSNIFVMENLAGRDLVKLRSRKLAEDERPVAYVPDDVMAEMLKEFRRFGFDRYATARPRNPLKYGATGEITIIDRDRRMTSLLRRKLQPGQVADTDHVKAAQAYLDCSRTYLAVWDHFRPQLQATTHRGKFGVKRAEFERQ